MVNVKKKTKENKLDFLIVLNIVLVYPWSGNQFSKVWKENKSILIIHSMYFRGLMIYPLPVWVSLSCSLYSMSAGSVAIKALNCFWAQERNSSKLDRLLWRMTWSSCWIFFFLREREIEKNILSWGIKNIMPLKPTIETFSDDDLENRIVL